MMNRRQFIGNGIGLATAVSLGSYTYFSRVPKKPTINVTFSGMSLGHDIRNQVLNQGPITEIPLMIDTLIVGSGVAALSAAWRLKKNGYKNVLLLNGPERNGNSASGHYESLNYPAGAHYLAEPSNESTHVKELLEDLGLLQNGKYDELATVHAPSERLWHNNQWQSELLPEQDNDSQRFFAHIKTLQKSYGNDGKRAFVIPMALSSQDEQYTQLDQLTFKEWLAQNSYQSESLLWYLNYCCLDDYGQGIEAVSAWAGLQYFAARTHGEESNQLLTWDGGLGSLADRLRAWIGFEKLTAFSHNLSLDSYHEADASALAIEEQEGEVLVDILWQQQRYRLRVKNVICATPLHIAQYIVKGFGGRYGFARKDLPTYAPWLIGNFVLKGFPAEHKSHVLAWDNVFYQQSTLGYINSTHQHITVAMPEKTVFTSYRVLDQESPDAVRAWLKYKATDDELLALALEDLANFYGKEFLWRIEHIDLTIRGHAMASPTPSFLSNQSLHNLRKHHSRLLFAHSDLSGYSIFEEASWWGIQAANKILAS